jgi:hypothetical protein
MLVSLDTMVVAKFSGRTTPPVIRTASLRSCLDLDLVDIECDEDRIGERSAAGSSWVHLSACGKDESGEASVVVAVVGGACPPADWLGNVVDGG